MHGIYRNQKNCNNLLVLTFFPCILLTAFSKVREGILPSWSTSALLLARDEQTAAFAASEAAYGGTILPVSEQG